MGCGALCCGTCCCACCCNCCMACPLLNHGYAVSQIPKYKDGDKTIGMCMGACCAAPVFKQTKNTLVLVAMIMPIWLAGLVFFSTSWMLDYLFAYNHCKYETRHQCKSCSALNDDDLVNALMYKGGTNDEANTDADYKGRRLSTGFQDILSQLPAISLENKPMLEELSTDLKRNMLHIAGVQTQEIASTDAVSLPAGGARKLSSLEKMFKKHGALKRHLQDGSDDGSSDGDSSDTDSTTAAVPADKRGWWYAPGSIRGCIMGYGPHNSTNDLGEQIREKSCRACTFEGDKKSPPQYSEADAAGNSCDWWVTNDPDRNDVVEEKDRLGSNIFRSLAVKSDGTGLDESYVKVVASADGQSATTEWQKAVPLQIPCRGHSSWWISLTEAYWLDIMIGQSRIGGIGANGYAWCAEACECFGGELVPDSQIRLFGYIFLVFVASSYIGALLIAGGLYKTFTDIESCDKMWKEVKNFKLANAMAMGGGAGAVYGGAPMAMAAPPQMGEAPVSGSQQMAPQTGSQQMPQA